MKGTLILSVIHSLPVLYHYVAVRARSRACVSGPASPARRRDRLSGQLRTRRAESNPRVTV